MYTSTSGTRSSGLWAALLLALTMLIASPAAAQSRIPWDEAGPSRGEDLVIELATFGPGSDVASWFGHTALVVKDRALGVERLYNYGMFHFDSTLVAQFLAGRLNFWVGATSVSRTLQIYINQDRDVRLLELNLPPEERLKIAHYLANNVKEENKYYIYHHYNDNCATRIRDAVDNATGGQFHEYASAPGRMTLRGHTRRHAQWPILDFGMMYAMGAVIDHPLALWDEMFLPGELEANFKAFKYKTKDGEVIPLAGKETIIHATKTRAPLPDGPSVLWPWMLLWGVLMGALGLGVGELHRKKGTRLTRVLYGFYHSGVGFWWGISGSLLIFLWFFSGHDVTHQNENLFYTSPLTLLIWPLGLLTMFGVKRAERALPYVWLACGAVGAIGFVFQLLPITDQDSSLTQALMLPMLAGHALAAWRMKGSAPR
jgi:hypothetical protein